MENWPRAHEVVPRIEAENFFETLQVHLLSELTSTGRSASHIYKQYRKTLGNTAQNDNECF